MPIKPENRLRYPRNWKQIRTSILERAHGRCEFCGVENHTYRYNERTRHMARIVLTIAQLATQHTAIPIICVLYANGVTIVMTQTIGKKRD